MRNTTQYEVRKGANVNKSNPDDYRYLVRTPLGESPREMSEIGDDLPLFGNLFEFMDDHEDDEFWDRMAEFDDQLENAKRLPLREYIGNPDVVPLSTLTYTELSEELDRLLDILAENSVYIDFLSDDIDEVEVYQFIEEMLLNEEVDDIRIEGFNQHFIYEEFFPEKYAKFLAEMDDDLDLPPEDYLF